MTKCWTFISEYKAGHTRVDQIFANDIHSAILDFTISEVAREMEIPIEYDTEGNVVPLDDDPVMVDGVKSVWCSTCLDSREKLVLIYVIPTMVD